MVKEPPSPLLCLSSETSKNQRDRQQDKWSGNSRAWHATRESVSIWVANSPHQLLSTWRTRSRFRSSQSKTGNCPPKKRGTFSTKVPRRNQVDFLVTIVRV